MRKLLLLLTLAVLLVQAGAVPASAGSEELLPDLAVARVEDALIQRTQGQTRLRFSSILLNVGQGPFEVEGSRPNGGDELMSTKQNIFDADGDKRTVPTDAVMYYSGDGHDHWHVRDLASYVLRRLDGAPVGTSEKHGFCFFDNYQYRLSLDGARPAVNYTHCGQNSSLSVKVGMSVGWGDVYEYSLVDQYIIITGLPAGTYRLVSTIDEQDWFEESDESNNSNWVELVIGADDSVTLTQFGPGPELFIDSLAEGAETADRTPTFSGRASPGAEVEVFVEEDGPGKPQISIGTQVANGSGAWSITVPAAQELAPDGYEAFAVARLNGEEAQTSKVAFTILAESGLPFYDGFESGDLGLWDFKQGMTVVEGDSTAGAQAARSQISASGAAYAHRRFEETQDEIYFGFKFKLVTGGSQTFALGAIRSQLGGGLLHVYVTPGGFLGIRNELESFSTGNTTSNVSVNAGMWHDLLVRLRIGASGESEVWLDGVRIDALSFVDDFGATRIGRVYLGESVSGRPHDVLYDEVSATVEPPERPVFHDDFESGDLSAWTKNFGVLTDDDANSGAFSASAASSGAATYAFYRFPTAEPEVLFSFSCKIESKSDDRISIAKLRQRNGKALFSLNVTKNDYLQYRNEVLKKSFTTRTRLNEGEWHDIQVRLLVDGGDSSVQIWVDGKPAKGLVESTDLGSAPVGRLIIGEVAKNRQYDFKYDDILLAAPANAPP